MAASYSHRTHLESPDMPAMHLCDVGAGVNALGYYMYHGGNNPHSTVHLHDLDDPATTLQESSFQPAGAANPMPSITYDFFAPLGEMGQPRSHYHSMRRMHTFLQSFGPRVAATTTNWPEYVPPPSDNTTLRWVVRRGDAGQGSFVFLNNYARTGHGTHPTMPPKHLVRLALHVNGSATPIIAIPSPKSEALTIPADIWAVWPVDLELLAPSHGGVGAATAASADSATTTLVYATAQLVARVKNTHGSGSAEVLFLTETEGVAAEFAFRGSAVTAEAGKATVTTEGGLSVFRHISAGTAAFASIHSADGSLALSIVLLPWQMADSLWLQTLDGAERLFLTDSAGSSPDVLVMADNQTLHFRTSMLLASSSSQQQLRMFPAVGGLRGSDGSAVPSTADGVFTAYTPKVKRVTISAPKITHVKAAGPPRNVSQPGGRHTVREPTMEEWRTGAAIFNLTLTQAIPATGGDYKLHVDYVGDAARIYFGERCLTDNWQSGYKGAGAMEVRQSPAAATVQYICSS